MPRSQRMGGGADLRAVQEFDDLAQRLARSAIAGKERGLTASPLVRPPAAMRRFQKNTEDEQVRTLAEALPPGLHAGKGHESEQEQAERAGGTDLQVLLTSTGY